MSIVIQCSLRKLNADKERQLLIDAGILTPWLNNTWIRMFQSYNSNDWIVAALYERTNYPNIIVNAKQFVQLAQLTAVNPNISVKTLLKTIRISSRNRRELTRYGLSHLLD